MRRKGSLNLSIEMIVVVVIAFVVLGLGLGFVRNQFTSIGDTTGSVQEQVKQGILDDLRVGNKKLSFPATSMNIEKGKSKDIAIGIKNTGNEALKYKIEITTESRQDGSLELDEQVTYFFDKGEAILKETEARVHSIRISAPGDQTTYLVKLKIREFNGDNLLPEPYDEKTFFVTIN